MTVSIAGGAANSVADVVVLGGGIAGLAAAYHLAAAKAGKVVLLEREPLLASHSSARNAAMFRHLESSGVTCWLAARSCVLLDEIAGGRSGWLRRTGAVYVARHRRGLMSMAANAEDSQVATQWVDTRGLQELTPGLAGTDVRVGLHVPADGIIDIHRVTDTLARAVGRAGGVIRCNTAVRAIRAVAGGVVGVTLADGSQISTGSAVIAGGAWSQPLGASCGAELSLVPMRRHLAQLESSSAAAEPRRPIVWRVDADEVYFRPESGGVLASPCDGEPWPPCLPPHTDEALILLAEKLGRLAPALAQSKVRRLWACLRTFAADRASVVGADPRVGGLYWQAGLGGHGMTTAVAEGEVLAASVCGAHHPLAAALAPVRLLAQAAEPTPAAAALAG